MEENIDEMNSHEERRVLNRVPRSVGKNNYTFNNCTVTINEEGKAVDVLQKRQELAEKKLEFITTLGGSLANFLSAYVKSKEEQQPKKKATKRNRTKKTKSK